MNEENIDRPGELLTAAVERANEMGRAIVVDLADPRDGTKALAFRDKDGVWAVNPTIFDDYRTVPLTRTGTAQLTRLDSFIALANRFRGPNSAVFANDTPAAPRLTVVFDYHEVSPELYEAAALQHRAEYAFPLSEEWKAWDKGNAQAMPMTDFAAFLEDRIVDVVSDANPSSPAAKDFVAKTGGNIASPSKLIEIARGLQINEASALREARNLSSGEAEVVFQSEHLDATGSKLVLPNLFMICIPVFARSPVFYQILARFRYRKSGSSIVFWYELWRPDLVFEQAFSEACEEVRLGTELPLFVGAPEA